MPRGPSATTPDTSQHIPLGARVIPRLGLISESASPARFRDAYSNTFHNLLSSSWNFAFSGPRDSPQQALGGRPSRWHGASMGHGPWFGASPLAPTVIRESDARASSDLLQGVAVSCCGPADLLPPSVARIRSPDTLEAAPGTPSYAHAPSRPAHSLLHYGRRRPYDAL